MSLSDKITPIVCLPTGIEVISDHSLGGSLIPTIKNIREKLAGPQTAIGARTLTVNPPL